MSDAETLAFISSGLHLDAAMKGSTERGSAEYCRILNVAAVLSTAAL